ncbi:uncharacterized protein [Atheta coriaria]|uniref:uncharacterized protein n=1 Tax=Dalotia coriaria TaxID=877792 RepID=UPI0031F46E24
MDDDDSVVWCRGGKSAKIYNALITSDENLSPSQAFPIIEPVLQTTALGVAPPLFQPLVVHQTQHNQQNQQQSNVNSNPGPANVQKIPSGQPQLAYHDAYSLYPVSYDPYLQYGYHQNYVYSPPLPYYQQPVYIDYAHQTNYANAPQKQEKPEIVQENQRPVVPVLPPQVPTASAAPPHVNFKKNPEIPDVIPPLPFTLRKETKQKMNQLQ